MSTNRLAWDEYFAAQALLIANRRPVREQRSVRFWLRTIRLSQQATMVLFQEPNIVWIRNAL